MDENKAKLWQEFWEKGDNGSIKDIINAYIHIIETMDEEVVPGHSDEELLDALHAEGIFALKDCLLVYPEECPIAFEDYCRDKVKQAMDEEIENYPNRKPIPW